MANKAQSQTDILDAALLQVANEGKVYITCMGDLGFPNISVRQVDVYEGKLIFSLMKGAYFYVDHATFISLVSPKRCGSSGCEARFKRPGYFVPC
ncbi:hypothetical protein [Aneurinibacillus danicus]|nr:hypothetical protein [Aneurinibacillus danicus]